MLSWIKHVLQGQTQTWSTGTATVTVTVGFPVLDTFVNICCFGLKPVSFFFFFFFWNDFSCVLHLPVPQFLFFIASTFVSLPLSYLGPLCYSTSWLPPPGRSVSDWIYFICCISPVLLNHDLLASLIHGSPCWTSSELHVKRQVLHFWPVAESLCPIQLSMIRKKKNRTY